MSFLRVEGTGTLFPDTKGTNFCTNFYWNFSDMKQI